MGRHMTRGDVTRATRNEGRRVAKGDAWQQGDEGRRDETLTPRYTRKAQADRAPGFVDKALSERWRSADKAQ